MMTDNADEEKRVTFRMDQERVNDFDDKIIQMKAEGDLPRDISRSGVIRMLMEEWVEGNSSSRQTGQPQTATATAD